MITLLILLIVVGLVLYVVESVLPIDPTIKLIIRAVVVIGVLVYVVQWFGLADWPGLRLR